MPAKPHSKTYLHFALGGMVFFAIVAWILSAQKESIAGVWRLLPLFSIPCVVMVLSLDFLQISFMGLRFWFLYPKAIRPSLPTVYSAISIGQVMNSFLPGRAGDFYKLAALNPKVLTPNHNILTLTGIFAADKVVDLVAFVGLIFLFQSYRHSIPDAAVRTFPSYYYVLGLVPVLLLVWHFYLRKYWRRIQGWFIQFFQGFKGMFNPPQTLGCLVSAALVWATEAFALQILAHYQNFTLSFSQAIYVLTVLNLALSIPISIANIGPFEASLAFAFTTLSLPMDKAIAIASVHHGLQMLAYVLSGALGWLIKRLALSRLG